jgi:anti-sigma factor RsiW
MNQELQLKLQAYLDNELSASDVREVEMLLRTDRDARELLDELRNTNIALRVFEAEIKVPESRDFYWSKIRRQIEREEVVPVARPVIAWWRRILVPAGAFAVLAIAAMLAFKPSAANQSPLLETSLDDSGAITYRDEAEGMTLVWFSYPPENEIAAVDTEDTID